MRDVIWEEKIICYILRGGDKLKIVSTMYCDEGKSFICFFYFLYYNFIFSFFSIFPFLFLSVPSIFIYFWCISFYHSYCNFNKITVKKRKYIAVHKNMMACFTSTKPIWINFYLSQKKADPFNVSQPLSLSKESGKRWSETVQFKRPKIDQLV